MDTSKRHYTRPLDVKHGCIDMNHGAGGRLSAQLVEEIFARAFDNEFLNQGNDGALFSQLLQDVQNNNPQQQAKMLTASKNVRSLGTFAIDGVRTTEYTGSYTTASALAVLSPSQRKVLGPELKQLTGAIRFSDWIDAQHHVRKTVITETVSGQQITLTTNTTAINQPVNIKLPPRRRVALIPAGSL